MPIARVSVGGRVNAFRCQRRVSGERRGDANTTNRVTCAQHVKMQVGLQLRELCFQFRRWRAP